MKLNRRDASIFPRRNHVQRIQTNETAGVANNTHDTEALAEINSPVGLNRVEQDRFCIDGAESVPRRVRIARWALGVDVQFAKPGHQRLVIHGSIPSRQWGRSDDRA